MKRNLRVLTPAVVCLLLAGCGSLSRLSEVGRAPAMTPTSDPTKEPTWRPVSMPMPAKEPTPNEANSLWRSGSRAFFKGKREFRCTRWRVPLAGAYDALRRAWIVGNEKLLSSVSRCFGAERVQRS
jgi:hypothetical protein